MNVAPIHPLFQNGRIIFIFEKPIKNNYAVYSERLLFGHPVHKYYGNSAYFYVHLKCNKTF